jgi:hypothetical protein
MHGERLPSPIARHGLEFDLHPRDGCAQVVIIEYGGVKKYILAAIIRPDKSIAAC